MINWNLTPAKQMEEISSILPHLDSVPIIEAQRLWWSCTLWFYGVKITSELTRNGWVTKEN